MSDVGVAADADELLCEKKDLKTVEPLKSLHPETIKAFRLLLRTLEEVKVQSIDR